MSFALALTSALLYGAADFLGGLASRRASTLSVVFVSQGVGLALLGVAMPWLPRSAPAPPDVFWGAVAGLAGGIGVGLLYRALAVGTMGVVAPTTALLAVAVPVCAAVALGERPGPRVAAGIVLAALAILLVSRPRGDADQGPEASASGLPPGFLIAVASGVAIGFFYLALARTAAAAGLWPLLAARMVSVSVFALAAVANAAPLRFSRGVAATIIGAGLLDMFANTAYLVASRSGPLSPVVTLASLYPASTVVLARLLLGERLSGTQVVGVGCALIAVAAIVGAP
jgi:drug/metabolite transporter (DMT)-like permease